MLSALRFEALEAHGGRSVGTLVTVLQRIMIDGGGYQGRVKGVLCKFK